MYLEILTPDKKLFEGDAVQVKLNGTMGGLEILNNHAPLLSTLAQKGEVIVRTKNNETLTFAIKGGVVDVLNNKISVLTEA